jgi:hypothetical protein
MSTVLKVDPAVLAKPVPGDHVQFMPFRDRADMLHSRPHFLLDIQGEVDKVIDQ